MKITVEDIERIASDPDAIRLFYESSGYFAIFSDGSYGIIDNDDNQGKDVVAKVLCPRHKFGKYLKTSFMDETVII